jgi:hypothetical protein
VLGQQAGAPVVDAGLGSDRPGDALVVAAEHGDPQAEGVQFGDRGGGLGAELVGDREQPEGLSVGGHDDGGLASRLQLGQPLGRLAV